MKQSLAAAAIATVLWAVIGVASGGFEVKYVALVVGVLCAIGVVRDRAALGAASGARAAGLAVLAIGVARVAIALLLGDPGSLLAVHSTPVALVAYLAAGGIAWGLAATPAGRRLLPRAPASGAHRVDKRLSKGAE